MYNEESLPFHSCRDFGNNVHWMQRRSFSLQAFLWNFDIYQYRGDTREKPNGHFFARFPIITLYATKPERKACRKLKEFFLSSHASRSSLRLYLSRYKSSDSCRSCISSTFASGNVLPTRTGYIGKSITITNPENMFDTFIWVPPRLGFCLLCIRGTRTHSSLCFRNVIVKWLNCLKFSKISFRSADTLKNRNW